MTFESFLEAVVLQAFPDGEPENLVTQHRNDVVDGLIHVQRFSPCHRSKNVEVYPYCSTYYQCGATVVPLPYKGRVQRVYTLPADRWCCPIFYSFVSDHDRFLNWLIARRPELAIPENLGLPDLGFGFKVAESTSDKGYRSDWGHYTIHEGRLYLGPHIESWERVVVEWEGVRRKYDDDTQVPIGIDFTDAEVLANEEGVQLINALTAKVLFENADRYTKDYIEADRQLAKWRGLVAELIHDCRQQLIPKFEPRYLAYDQLEIRFCAPSECSASSVSSSSSGSSASSASSASSTSSTPCDMVLSGHGPPASDPGVNYVIEYFDLDTDQVWYWNPSAHHWVLLIK